MPRLPPAANADTKFIAGGTDLMQLMKDWVERPKHLVDIDRLPLDRIEISRRRRANRRARPHERCRRPPRGAAPSIRSSPRRCSPAPRRRCAIWRRSAATCCSAPAAAISATSGFAATSAYRARGCPAINGENRLLAIFGGSDHCVATHASDLAVALVALDAAVELRGASQTGEFGDVIGASDRISSAFPATPRSARPCWRPAR